MKLIVNKYFYIAFTWSFLGLWELMGAIKGYQPSWWMVLIPMLNVLGNKWFDYIVFTACEETIMKRVNEDHQNGDILDKIKDTFITKDEDKNDD